MQKPKLTFWQIWNMSFGFLGIQFGFALQNANVSRIFETLGAILASLALIIMPNSPVLWIAAGMLWIMDASINISMEPFRAFVGDMLPSEQRTYGFATQSFFIGTGAVIASVLPYVLTNWFHIQNTAPAGQIPLSVKLSFYIGGVVFISAVIWTIIRLSL